MSGHAACFETMKEHPRMPALGLKKIRVVFAKGASTNHLQDQYAGRMYVCLNSWFNCFCNQVEKGNDVAKHLDIYVDGKIGGLPIRSGRCACFETAPSGLLTYQSKTNA